MGSLYRSELMSLCQMFIQSESAYDSINELGELGLVQFRDLNPSINAFQRKFVNELRRCDEMERKLNFFENEISNENLPMLDYDEEPGAPASNEMTKLEHQLDKIERDILSVNQNASELKKNLLELTELRFVLKYTQKFFESESSAQAEIHRRLSHINIDQNAMRRFSINPVGTPPFGSQLNVNAPFGSQLNVNAPSSPTLSLSPNPIVNVPLDPVTDINFIAGTLIRTKMLTFEQMCWRICKGNVFIRRVDIDDQIEDSQTGELVYKCIFIIVLQGQTLFNRVKKVCEGFHATTYPCPELHRERQEMLIGVINRIQDMELVMKQTDEHRKSVLVAAAKNINLWKIQVCKMKSIYETLNKFSFDITSKCLVGEGWCPINDIPLIQDALARGQKASEGMTPSIFMQIQTAEEPPTYFKTNKVTRGFQNIVDAYGVGSYREVNPAPYTIISFPFLFAIMFGDAGHGILMTMLALILVVKEKYFISKKIRDEIWLTFFNGRYTILLMGLFSIYTGFIYNDFFSKSANIFGCKWYLELDGFNASSQIISTPIQLDPSTSFVGFPYAYGIDPIWQLASNKISFLNSFKMKLSVILGVIQMFFGVILSLMNHLYFKDYAKIILEFIPRIMFLMAIFGYMNLMIFMKWFKYDASSSGCAPSILITLINMFLMKTPSEDDLCSLKEPIYESQFDIQKYLVLLALISVPWMLFIMPFYLKCKSKNSKKTRFESTSSFTQETYHHNSNDHIEMADQGSNKNNNSQITLEIDNLNGESSKHNRNGSNVNGGVSSVGVSGGHDGGEHGKGEFDFGDAFIHQAIHTIEYCLGLISHTASYLRLWALSLAHAQLSEVLWNMVMVNGFMSFEVEPDPKLTYHSLISGILMFIIFAVWAVLTFAILLFMEGLSAFLHALRLHWVEFQSKFYEGNGYLFEPFSFKHIIELMESS